MNVDSILPAAEALLAQARATSELKHGTPLRTDRMTLEHRQLRQTLSDLIEYHRGYESEHNRLVRLVAMLRDALTQGTNGTRFWTPTLPPRAKTVLTLINTLMRSSD